MADATGGPLDPAIREKVLASFAQQGFPRLLGARIVELDSGVCVIEMAPRAEHGQQHGYVHAGVVSTLADTSAGYASLSLMPADANVLTTEFKINLLAPARGERLRAVGRVSKAGRTLVVATAEVSVFDNGVERSVALFQGTMICLRDSADDVRG